jgi:signal transduction histidine kinase
VTMMPPAPCEFLQEIGLPAVRVKPTSAEVIEFNGLFSSLVKAVAPLDYRLWFVEGVLPHFAPADRARWEVTLADRTSAQVHVAFKSVEGRVLDFEMRSSAFAGQKKLGQSILCVFIPYTNSFFERVCDAHLAEGRELERNRIRNELHQGVSQQLLGAAFGCKLLAGRVVKLSEDLGKEASDLAELLNEAVLELQHLLHSSENQS